MFDKGASFVTLEKNKELRGCIGTIVPHTAISHDIARNTYKAALEDDRFEPVTEEELKDISIHISLLTDFERIRYLTEDDLLEQVIAGTDGLIIRDGNRQGLFLPAVWEKIPDKKTFLRELKIKAGISPSYQNNKIKIYRFRTVGVENED
jgi:AmmeMemoRadiSam system protein A